MTTEGNLFSTVELEGLLGVVALLVTRGSSFSACDFGSPERRLRIAAKMALRSLSLLVVVVVVTLRESCFGASSHSLKYFLTSISDPSQGQQPHFVSLGYVDDQLFSYYDSHSRREQPRASWLEKVGKEDPHYWERNTQRERGNEETFRGSLENLRIRYNQSEGLHTWQRMSGCELRGDGSKGGFWQYGYEGRTFITFDKETLTWVTPDPQAQITQRKRDAIPGYNQRWKDYLEEICIEWLEKYLSYGEETLLRTAWSSLRFREQKSRRGGKKDIDATWRRDGEVWLEETFHGSVAPTADGTYHYWLSIRIDPKERSRYRCHVEHDGLQEPLDLELKEPSNSKSNLGLIIGCVVAALVLACAIAGILIFFTSDRGSSSSDQGSNRTV